MPPSIEFSTSLMAVFSSTLALQSAVAGPHFKKWKQRKTNPGREYHTSQDPKTSGPSLPTPAPPYPSDRGLNVPRPPSVGSPIAPYHSTFLTPYVTHTICNFKWGGLFIVSSPSPASKLSKDRNSVCLKWHQALTPGSHPGRRWWKHNKTDTKAESTLSVDAEPTPVSSTGWVPFLFSSESPRHRHPSAWDIMSLLKMQNYLSSIFLPIGCLGSVLSTIRVLADFPPLHVRAHTHTSPIRWELLLSPFYRYVGAQRG